LKDGSESDPDCASEGGGSCSVETPCPVELGGADAGLLAESNKAAGWLLGLGLAGIFAAIFLRTFGRTA
jgi:hypothetical protein